MLYSIIYKDGKELTSNKLRNEIIYAFKTDESSVEYEGETYHIEKMVAERAGYKQIQVKKD